MSDCGICIYELVGHRNGEMIRKLCRDGTRCPYYNPKEPKGAESGKERKDETKA